MIKIKYAVLFFIFCVFFANYAFCAGNAGLFQPMIDGLEKSLNRKTAYADLKMSFSGLTVYTVRLYEKAPDNKNVFVKAAKATVEIEPAALTYGQLKIKNVVVDDPEINIIRNKDCSFNISDLAASRNAPNTPISLTANIMGTKSDLSYKIKFNNAVLVYTDNGAGKCGHNAKTKQPPLEPAKAISMGTEPKQSEASNVQRSSKFNLALGSTARNSPYIIEISMANQKGPLTTLRINGNRPAVESIVRTIMRYAPQETPKEN